jgi:hypothetical protein
MKTILLFIFLSSCLPGFCQVDLYITAGAGSSKYFNFQAEKWEHAEVKLIPISSAKFGADLVWQARNKVELYTGLHVFALGNKMKFVETHQLLPNREFRFRHTYLQLPIGLNYPVFKSYGLCFSLNTGLQLSERNKSDVIYAVSKLWESSVSPGLYARHKNWRFSFSYYIGLVDVLGQGKNLDSDFRYYNHAIHFNVAYKLRSFDKN